MREAVQAISAWWGEASFKMKAVRAERPELSVAGRGYQILPFQEPFENIINVEEPQC